MNLPIPDHLLALYQQCLDQPGRSKGLIQKNISGNRSLSSKLRRASQHWIMQGLRWQGVYAKLRGQDKGFDDYQLAVDIHIAKLEQQSFASDEALVRDYDFPLWMVEGLAKIFSEIELKNILDGLQQPPQVFLRMNIYRQPAEVIKQSLQQDDIKFEVCAQAPHALVLLEKAQVTKARAFKKGWVEVQDIGSQIIVDQMQLAPKLNIIDGCCRSGGKSLAMQNYIQGQSTIHAVDIDARVLDEMKKRIKRTEAQNIKAHWVGKDEQTPLAELEAKADRVLVDAPCSSIGTLRSRPWLKWQYQIEDIKQFSQQQQQILSTQSKWVKPGGLLIYAVCSLLPEETTTVVANFLKEHPEFAAVSSQYLLPSQTGGDGFYYQVFKMVA